MKNFALTLLASLLFCVSTSFAQSNVDWPKKPIKEPETAEEHYQAARWADHGESDYPKAYAHLEKALLLDPNFADAYYLRGHLYREQGKCKEAIADYDIVISVSKDAVNAYQVRAECKVRLKDYQGALADLDTSVAQLAAKQLIQYNAFVNRGKVKYILGKYDAAIDDFTSAVNMNTSVAARYYRAFTHIRKGDDVSAIADLKSLGDDYWRISEKSRIDYPDVYKEPLRYPPGNDPLATLDEKPVKAGDKRYTLKYVGAGVGVSASVACKGCPTKEFAKFNDKIVMDNWFFPSDKTFLPPLMSGDDIDVVFYLLGRLQTERGEVENAAESFTRGINSLSTAKAFLYFERGKLLLQTQKFEPAVRDLSWAISGVPSPLDAYLERGIAIFMLGHDQLAQTDFDRFLKLVPEGKEMLEARLAEAREARKALQAAKDK